MTEKLKNKKTEKQTNKLILFVFWSFSFFVFMFSILCFSVSSYADKIYLKDGRTYDGKLIGKSPRRFLFSVDLGGGDSYQMSFFTEEVQKLELGRDTVETQIPYLKEVESSKFEVKEEEPKTYELSIYKDGSKEAALPSFTTKEMKSVLNEQEAEYYQRFNDILKKYMDKFAAIQNIFANLTTSTREDFSSMKQYMDELYFELNNLYVPEAFKKAHIEYLESVRATFLVFHALEQGSLDEAAKQMKISEESKQRSVFEFREVLLKKGTKIPQGQDKTQVNSPTDNEARNPQ